MIGRSPAIGALLVTLVFTALVDAGPWCECPDGLTTRWVDKPWPHCLCYKFVRDLASWAEAKVYCGVMGAWMMEVKDDVTQSWLKRRLHDYQVYHHHHLLEKAEYWLGATDLQWEKHWKWDNSNTYVSYFQWLPSEPNNYLGYQNCLAVRRRCPDDADCFDYGWFDDDCYQKKFYICETKGILRGVPSTKPPPLQEKKVDTA